MASGTADPLDDALEDLRVSGSVLLWDAYMPPWAIAVPAEANVRELLGVAPGTRVIPFHLVRRNRFTLAAKSTRSLTVVKDEVLLCPGGLAHQMSVGPRARIASFADVLARNRRPASVSEHADATELICGVFMLRAAPMNPLLQALPPFVKVSLTRSPLRATLSAASEMLVSALARGPKASFAVARTLEIFCAETIRAYQGAEGAATAGWFRGLADPRVSEALGRFHAAPGADWDVGRLARCASLSPSRFAARFRQLTGRSVMSYVVQWRMNLACRLLQHGERPVSEIAAQVGYTSPAAFNRAFRHALGTAPGYWRERARAGRS